MNKWNDIFEAAMLGKVVEALLNADYRVVVSDQDGHGDGALWVYGIADNGERAPRDGYAYWVKCIPGNGAYFISDYTTNLEATLAPVNAFAASCQ